MNTRTSRCVFFTVLLIGAAAFAQESTTPPGSPAPNTKPAPRPRPKLLEAGSAAPDFISNDAAGKPVHLSDLKGKIVVLDFWATWCGPCMRSLPHTEAAAKRFKDQGVVVLACCTSDTRAKFDEWIKANQETYPDIIFTCDPNERGSATFADRVSLKSYRVSGIPTQFIIGRDNRIAASVVGFRDGDERLAACLAQVGVQVDPAIAATGEEQIKEHQ
jgi:thiol-disulfide isomerase/thioredoxin